MALGARHFPWGLRCTAGAASYGALRPGRRARCCIECLEELEQPDSDGFRCSLAIVQHPLVPMGFEFGGSCPLRQSLVLCDPRTEIFKLHFFGSQVHSFRGSCIFLFQGFQFHTLCWATLIPHHCIIHPFSLLLFLRVFCMLLG